MGKYLLLLSTCIPFSDIRESNTFQFSSIWVHISWTKFLNVNRNTLEKAMANPMDGEAWWAAVHGVAKSQTPLSDFTFTFHFHALEKEMQPTPVFFPGESQG